MYRGSAECPCAVRLVAIFSSKTYKIIERSIFFSLCIVYLREKILSSFVIGKVKASFLKLHSVGVVLGVFFEGIEKVSPIGHSC